MLLVAVQKTSKVDSYNIDKSIFDDILATCKIAKQRSGRVPARQRTERSAFSNSHCDMWTMLRSSKLVSVLESCILTHM